MCEEKDGKCSDDEWEDIVEEKIKVKKKRNYQSLKNFSRACDRYKVSDRASAFIGRALFIDLQIVKKDYLLNLICPSKLQRERFKWGKKTLEEHKREEVSDGFYMNGK